MAQRERKVGQQALEIDFLEEVLAENRRKANSASSDWKAATCEHIQRTIEKGAAMTPPAD